MMDQIALPTKLHWRNINFDTGMAQVKKNEEKSQAINWIPHT